MTPEDRKRLEEIEQGMSTGIRRSDAEWLAAKLRETYVRCEVREREIAARKQWTQAPAALAYARISELESALFRIVGFRDPANKVPDSGEWACCYCGVGSHDPETIVHAENCPWLEGRRVLGIREDADTDEFGRSPF